MSENYLERQVNLDELGDIAANSGDVQPDAITTPVCVVSAVLTVITLITTSIATAEPACGGA